MIGQAKTHGREKKLSAKTRRRNIIKKQKSWLITSWVMFAFYAVFALFYVYILFWLLMTGFKTQQEIALNPFSLPKVLHWANWGQMVTQFEHKGVHFWGMLWNSTWVSVGGSFIMMLTSAVTSYIATRYKFPGSKFIAPFIMFTLVFPIYGSAASNYRMMYKLGLHDGPLYLLFFVGFGGWNWFYFQSFWLNLSKTYAEAAKIDGANDWTIFYKIMFPQARGMFLALFITTWINQWQDYGSALLYLNETPTLSLGIYYFQTKMKYAGARTDLLFCACFISTLPIFLIYTIFNGFMFKNVSVGGIKL
jgi:ABC-type glycerol-3-phosphate transport system permease component